MERLSSKSRPSLERLKALDELPDLSSQLEAAKQLCNHAARADMICKWLLEKLHSKYEARQDLKAWDTLQSTLRLLSPERTASLLASHNFLETCKTALDESDNLEELLPVVRDTIDLLLDISKGPHGTSIKAVLSVPSAQAASFLGVWLRVVHDVATSAKTQIADDARQFSRPPGIAVWNMRKHSGEDNDEFAKHCMAPAAAMLRMFSLGDTVQHVKRKRPHGQSSEDHFKHDLESMIARHIFLPSRTAFSRAQDLAESKGRRATGYQNPVSFVNSVLEPLRVSLVANPLDDGSALPPLMDIALRCAPVTTPKERIRERPWVEAVFEALIECDKNPDGEVMDGSVVARMLSVVGQRASMSKEALERVVKQHAHFDKAPQEVDWRLVSQVIAMDSDVFVSQENAGTLFTNLTNTTIEASELNNEAAAVEFRTSSKERVIVPILKAFARRRDLATFIQLWQQQLRVDRRNTIWSVWAQLEDSFQQLLEDSLTTNQIMDLCDRFFNSIKEAANAQSSDGKAFSQARLDSSIVVLNSLLAGVRSEALVDELQEKLNELTTSMFRLCDKPTAETSLPQLSAANEKQTWALMRKAFELWFPTWATQESNTDAIAAKGISFLKSDAVKTALSLAKIGRRDHSAMRSVGVACDAETFVASLCVHFHKYNDDLTDECSTLCAETTDELVQQLDPGNLQALLRYPALIETVYSEVLNDFLIMCLSAATGAGDFTNASALQALHAFAATAVQHAQKDVVESLVAVCLRHMEPNEGENDEDEDNKDDEDDEDDEFVPMNEEPVVVELLSKLPVGSLSRTQREEIINAVSQAQTNTEASHEPQLQSARFALLVKLFAVPNATSTIATDPDELWHLARSISSNDDSIDDDTAWIPDPGESKPLALLQELAGLLLEHLLATQDQERSRLMLTSYSADVKKHVNFMSERGQLDGCGRNLTLIKPIMSQLEVGSRADLKSQLAHRDPRTMEKFIRMSFNLITGRLSKEHDVITDLAERTWLLPALELLLAVPTSLLQSLDLDLDVLLQPLLKSMFPCLARCRLYKDNKALSLHLQTIQAMMVRCYEVGCKYAEGTNAAHFAALGTEITELNLQSTERAKFLESFARCVDQLSPEQKVMVIDIIFQKSAPISLALLSLADVCAAKLDKTNAVATTGFSASRVLPKFLAIAVESDTIFTRKKAMSCALTVLKKKPSLVNQYSIEVTMASIRKILHDRPTASPVHLEVCQIMSTLLLQYRSRLQGRFHLVVEIFEDLILRLFKSTRSPPPKGIESRVPTVKHAQALARLLTLFCEPPQMRRQSKTAELVDQSRKEQAHVGQYVQYVLHHYCSQVLSSTLADGMREALTPGLWSVIEAMEMNNAEGVKCLSAAMNNSERAVLRGVYDDWRRFGKWRGG